MNLLEALKEYAWIEREDWRSPPIRYDEDQMEFVDTDEEAVTLDAVDIMSKDWQEGFPDKEKCEIHTPIQVGTLWRHECSKCDKKIEASEWNESEEEEVDDELF